ARPGRGDARRRRRGRARGDARLEPGLRRDPGRARDRAHHRAGRLSAVWAGGALPGAGVHFVERRSLLAAARRLAARGMLPATSGNLSIRIPGGFIITPSGAPYDELEPAELVALDDDGRPSSHGRPSTEWRLHR